jgi:DNA modification methylase
VVLDPFMGSGSTALACIAEGRSFIGIEQDADAFATAEARIEIAQREPRQEVMPL